MEFSKITEIEIFNFMSIKHAKLTYDEEGIINLKGYNHSGKSSILKALAVCLSNYSPRNQVNFIHHGEEYFRVIVTFDDKVNIVRDKYINGQSLYEMYKDEKKIFTTKQGSQLLKVAEVPQPIKDYVQLIETDRGILNIQFRKDPLWLVDTKGSENYLDLNEILRTVEISRANSLLNADKNKLSTELSTIESELQGAKIALEGYSDLEENLLVLLSEKEVAAQSVLSRNECVSGIKSTASSISSVKVPPEVSPVDCKNLEALSELQELVSEVEGISIPPEVEKSDFGMLSALESLKEAASGYERVKDSALLGLSVESVPTEYLEKKKSLFILINMITALEEAEESLSKLDAEDAKYKKGRDKILVKAKEAGIKFVVCENCGTLMEVNTNG